MAKKLPKSLRKFLRKEKARIRREILDFSTAQEEISKLIKRYLKTKEKRAKIK